MDPDHESGLFLVDNGHCGMAICEIAVIFIGIWLMTKAGDADAIQIAASPDGDVPCHADNVGPGMTMNRRKFVETFGSSQMLSTDEDPA